jgi:1-acyl-sn-glycerol-3-phosphate acyltransferase
VTRSPNRPPNLRRALSDSALRALMCAAKLYSLRYHDLTIGRPCPVPRRGPGIIVCNHISGLDPVLIQSACPRPITWMMAAEYYTWPLGWMFRVAGVIPVERSGRDLAATREALRALREGKLLGLFPEGRISTTHEILPFQSGVAVMATRSGAPVYPAYIDGSQRGRSMAEALLEPQTSQVTFGKAVTFDADDAGADQLPHVVQRIHEAVQALAGNHLRNQSEKVEMIGRAGRSDHHQMS